jgi:hypothetical protein
MSYYVMHTSDFTTGTYITINYQYSDVLGDLLSSNAYYIKAIIFDSNKTQIGNAIIKNNEPNISITINKTDGQGFGTDFYIAIELNIQQIQDFDTNWITKLAANNIKLGISTTITSDSESYWELAFNADIGLCETEYIDINWDYSSAFTYNSAVQGILLNNTNSDIKITYANNQKTDAGSYTATATLSYGKKYIVRINGETVANGSSCSKVWQINPKPISLTGNLLISSANSIDYSAVQNWSNFKTLVKPTFSEENFTYYNLSGISDGTYLYTDSDKSSTVKTKLKSLGYSSFVTKYTYIPGSTYIGYIEITNNNYVLEGQDYIYIKYKTAKIDSTYYTIEDAINNTSTTAITMVGNPTTTEAQVQITAFSKLLDTKSYTNSNHNLIVPYESGNTTENYTEEAADKPASKNICSCLYIPSGITYNTTKLLSVTSKIAGQGVCGDHGVIINDGTINFNNGSSLYAYGYLKGLGKVVISSGVKVKDVMAFKDYPGSAPTAKSLSDTCFPIFAWVLNNISCKTQYMKGSEMICHVNVYGASVGFQATEVTIIGKSSETANCLFAPSTAATSADYIEKYTNSTKCNTLFAYDNQNKVLSDINLSGSYEDRTLEASLTVLKIYKVSFGTSYTKPLPISYTNVNVVSGSLTVSSGSYYFLQGTKLVVNKGAELIVNGNSYIVFDKTGSDALCSYFETGGYVLTKTNAVLEANGTVSGTGSIAGTVETNTEDAKLEISSYKIAAGKIAYKTSKTEGATNENILMSQFKKIDVSSLSVDSEYSTISNGEYNSLKANNNYGWIASKAVIDYDLNGGESSAASKTVAITSTGYTITNEDVAITSTKQYYNFTGWTLNGTNPVGQTIYEGVTIIAQYTPIDYTISYCDVNGGTDLTTTWNNPSTFNYETNTALIDPTRGDLTFGGWFLDEALTTKASALSGATLVKYLSNDSLTLYASWYSSDSVAYTIKYNNENSNGVICQELDKIVETENFDWTSVTLPDMSGNDNDYNVATYFDGWYNGSTKVTSITSDMFDENKELSLKAVYVEKNKLKLQSSGVELSLLYYKPGYTFTIPDLSSYSIIKIPTSYVFVGWSLSDGTNTELHQAGETITLTNQTTLDPEIKQYVNFSVVASSDSSEAASYTTVTVTLTTGEGYLVSVNGSKSTATVFNGEIKTFGKNGSSTDFYVTVGSKFKAKYTTSDKGSATITGTDPTTALSTSDQEYSVTSDVTITYLGSGCVVQGTLITLADGTKKKVEDITTDDTMLVFNHETGKYDFAKVNFIDSDPYDYYTIINLKFSNGNCIKVISEHGFFDLDLMQYVYIDEFNYKDYIGHKFYSATWDGETYQNDVVTLNDAYITKEYTKCYSPVTMYHLNYFTEDVLSMPGGISGLFNIFEYDEDLKYNSEKMQADIEKYGLFSYEYFEDKVPYDVYLAFPAQYFKVAMGKGILTEEQLLLYIERYLPLMN